MQSNIRLALLLLGRIFIDIGVAQDDDTCDVGSGKVCKSVGGFSLDIANKWIDCVVTPGIDCDVACMPPTPQEVFQAEVGYSKAYLASLEDDQGSKKIASQATRLASQALELLKKLGSKVEDHMRDDLDKLAEVHENLQKDEEILRLNVEGGVAKRKDLLTSLIAIQTQNRESLSRSIEVWTDSNLLKRNDKTWDASVMPNTLHKELDKLEFELISALRKLKHALQPMKPGLGLQVRADKVLKEALPMLKDGYFNDGIIESFKQHSNKLEIALKNARSEGFPIVNAGRIASLFNVNPKIIHHFVNDAVRQPFVDLIPCMACEKSAYNLSSYAGGSRSDAFVCLKLDSKCLKDTTVCGCYRASDPVTLLERGDLPEEFSDTHHVSAGCKYMIFPALVAPVDIGSSLVSPVSTCAAREANIRQKLTRTPSQAPLRICMVTWNVGSERDMPGVGAGVGWGGVVGAEFRRDLDRLFQEACTSDENDVVVLGFQEASETQTKEVIRDAVEKSFGQRYITYVYANAVEQATGKGYNGLEYLFEFAEPKQYFAGVNLVVISRFKPKSVRLFGLIFQGGVFKEGFKKGAAMLGDAPLLGDKGTAIARIKLVHDGRERIMCFASSHFDAGKESKRIDQTAKTQEALKAIGCPDGAWWGGDFNPRLLEPQSCCPWDHLQLLMHHGAKEAVVDLSRSIDPIGQGYSWRKDTAGAAEVAPFVMPDWQCQGKQCSAGWHEFPIGFAPTFHKVYSRSRDLVEGTCRTLVKPRPVPRVGLHGPQGLVSLHDLQLLNNASLVVKPGKDGKCPGSGHRVEMCWNAEYNLEKCKNQGYCHHVHHKDHCPLYTDRILHAFNIDRQGRDFRKIGPDSEFPIVVGCRYEAIPTITSADHAPVFAQFRVIYSDE